MRVLVWVVAVLGCKSKSHRLDHLQLPEVTLADAVIAPTGPVPPLVMIDANDVPSLAVADGSWQALAAANPAPAITLDSGATRYVGYQLVFASYARRLDDAKAVVITGGTVSMRSASSTCSRRSSMRASRRSGSVVRSPDTAVLTCAGHGCSRR